MKVTLDVDKTPFCTIGPYNFTYDEPEHDVSVVGLPEDLAKQLLYNVRRGTLRTDDMEALKHLADVPVATPSLMPAAAIPIRTEDVTDNMESTIDKNRKALKKVLTGTIPSVKKESAEFRLGSIRKLLELEKEGKNRKKLIAFFEARMTAHTQEVTDAKGGEDLEATDAIQSALLSTQLTDIVVSEEEEVIVPQEVLNQLKTGV